jgi:DNA mismatch endonuclease (patch repair protein)
MDIWDKRKRSEVMSKIGSRNTGIERLVRRWLFSFGYRFRTNDKRYPGTPDILLPKYKTAVFVNGCFWHGHDCRIGRMPKSNREFWSRKISRNKKRDSETGRLLERLGWKVVTVWECELRWNPESRLIQLLGEIRGEDYTDFCM